MKKLLGLTLLLLTSMTAHATLIDSSIEPEGIDYTYFSIDTDTTVTIETFDALFDPEMFLLTDDGSLDSSDYITYNDDSGLPALAYYNSYIQTDLSAGSYVIAVGDFNINLTDVIAGYADNSYSSYGGFYSLQITVADGTLTVEGTTVDVPEPSTLALFGIGLAGLLRRKKYAS